MSERRLFFFVSFHSLLLLLLLWGCFTSPSFFIPGVVLKMSSSLCPSSSFSGSECWVLFGVVLVVVSVGEYCRTYHYLEGLAMTLPPLHLFSLSLSPLFLSCSYSPFFFSVSLLCVHAAAVAVVSQKRDTYCSTLVKKIAREADHFLSRDC